jgi:hypothetical protein
MRAIFVLVGFASGAVVGFAAGVLFAMGLGYWAHLSNPDDPSAGSVAIVSIATAPFGAMAGAVLGGLAMDRKRRLYCATILPLAILLIIAAATCRTLERMDRPRHFEVELYGTPGAEFVGRIIVMGNADWKTGTLPARFAFTARGADLAFYLVDRSRKKQIGIKVLADGANVYNGGGSTTGEQLLLNSYGYSETFGGTSYSSHYLTEDEVESLAGE